MKLISAFICGLIFSVGLGVGGMTNPDNIIGFLDLTGIWKPALALVMGGAILVFSLSYIIVRRRARPLFEDKFHLPDQTQIDTRLLTGAAIFGIGWGLSGFCPGPALTALGAGASDAIIFVPFMIAGMWLCKF